ncbi:TPA: flagellar hook-basal body complex protein [Vibrio vulnificus]|nr:flagellar hook-basal body complex protein [Vibrio vulnificus]
MINALSNAELALQTHQKNIDMISHNVSNINTPGYKASRPVFNALVSQGEQSSASRQGVGQGVSLADTVSLFTTGELKFSGSPLDVAIQGNGLLEVELENGDLAYSRIATLRKLEDGTLATVNGHRLTANVIVPPDVTEMVIGSNGEVTGKLSNTEESVSLGQIDLAIFDSFESLKVSSQGLWLRTEEAGDLNYARPGEDGAGELLQGFVEMSNVNMINEMVSLMSAQRAYQLNSRVVQVSDQILETINNLSR